MRIDTTRIPLDGLEINQEIEISALDLDRSDLKFISPINVAAELLKTFNVVSADVNIKARVKAICSRCLKEEEKDLLENYKFNYEIRKEERFIDLEPDIREEIILGYSLKLLCKPECKGLCVKCGSNLNLGKCKCQMKT